MGFALINLKAAECLNTPTGQLVVAAAIIDDVIALVLLNEVEALSGGGAGGVMEFLRPLLFSVAFVAVGGAIAVWLMPPLLQRALLPRVPTRLWPPLLLALMLLTALALIPACEVLGVSPLLGCFLAGLCYCDVEEAHRAWQKQAKRLVQWAVRFFFSATVAFDIPVQEFGSAQVWLNAVVFSAAIVGKLATGVLAAPLTL